MSPRDVLMRHVPPTYQALGVIITIAGVGWTAGWAPISAEVSRLKADQELTEDVVVDIRVEIAEIRRAQRADSVREERNGCILTALARERDPVEECGL
jgi:hypothetical protein